MYNLNLFQLGNSFGFWYLLLMFTIMGACFGSFLNVVILRAFSGESIVLPPSKCPKCHNKLKWYHNIPILSYIFLRGKCGFCKEHISWQYPIVETVYAILFVSTILKFGITLNAFFLCAVLALCVVLSVTDIKEQVIFDRHAYILAAIGLVYNAFDIGKSGLGVYKFTLFSHNIEIYKAFVFAILGLIAGAVIMEILAFIGKLFVGKRAFGEGDSFILGALGAVFGLKAVPYILIWGCVVQVIAICPMFIKKLIEQKEYKLIIGLCCFCFTVLLFKLLEHLNVLSNLYVLFGAFLLMLIAAVYTCKKLIESTKKGENLTYVPFGPPLVVAAIALMFFVNL